MGENFPRTNRNVDQDQNQGVGRTRMGDHYAPIRSKLFTEIAPPIGEDVNFKIDTAFINSLPNFHGLPSENPYTYLEELVGKCYLYHIPGVSNEILKMKVFPQTLKDRAKDWFRNLGLKFESWDEIEDCFLKKFYSSGKTKIFRQAIQGFRQGDEAFSEARERFKDLTRQCPHHGFDNWQLINIFYEGLTENCRNRIDAICGGSIMDKYDDEVEELIERLAENDSHRLSLNHHGRNGEPKRGGVLNVKGVESEIEKDLTNKRLGTVEATLGKMAEMMQKLMTNANVAHVQEIPCSLCFSRNHADGECVGNYEEVNAMNQASPYNSWSNRGNMNYNKDIRPPYPPKPYFQPYNQQPRAQNDLGNSSMQVMQGMMEQLTRNMQTMSEQMSQMARKVEQLEMDKLNQAESNIDNMKGKGKEMDYNKGRFPTQPVINPRNVAFLDSDEISPLDKNEGSVQAISQLRSGKQLADPYDKEYEGEGSKEEEKLDEDSGHVDSKSIAKGVKPSDYQPPIPFPEALKSSRPLVQSNKLIEALKETTINIPLEEAIKYIPSFSKYVKELCTPHRRPTRIKLSESVSSILLNEIPQKKKDPGAPLITCDIGGMKFSRSLLDSGASVNLLPKALYDKFKFGELEPIFLELQLADGSIKQPLGILEDVMVRVEHCIFPVDFIVAEMNVPDHLSRAPIILGRPFLATARAVTDWEKGLVVLRVGEESVELNISRLMKYPSSSHEDVGILDLVDDDFDYRENFLEICGVDQL